MSSNGDSLCPKYSLEKNRFIDIIHGGGANHGFFYVGALSIIGMVKDIKWSSLVIRTIQGFQAKVCFIGKL